jgi:hypothetical protein
VIEIVPATLEHAADLAPRLRAADRQEIEAMSGRDPAEALAHSIGRGLWSEALMIDGQVEALGGLGTVSMLFGPGVPWLMGSDRLTERARWFLRESRRQVARMRETYGELVNWVDARNTLSVRYLERLGFTIDPAAPFGIAGLPFHRFHLGLKNV